MNCFYSEYRGHDDSVSDDENPVILDICIVKAEETMCEIIDDYDVDFSAIKTGMTKLYNAIIEAWTDKYYWKEHAKYYEYIL